MSVRQRSYLLHSLLVAASIVIVLVACWIATRVGMSLHLLFYATLIISAIALAAACIFRGACPVTSRRGFWLRRVGLAFGIVFALLCALTSVWHGFHICHGYPGNEDEFRLTPDIVEFVHDRSNETMHAVTYLNAPGYIGVWFPWRPIAIIAIAWVILIVIEQLGRRYPYWSALPWEEKGATPGFCEKCGYNLSGNVSGICPECGTSICEPKSSGS